MRISDWSSDVCSSDLVAVGLAVAPFGGDEDFAMFLEIHQPIRHGEIVDVEQRAGALEGRRIFAVRVDHHDMTLRRELADLVEDQRRARRLRSEEHTSELQSLMRISYAVFCLKKKKH